MRELYKGNRIFIANDDSREIITPISFMMDDVIDVSSGKGRGLPFENKEPKTHVRLNGGREYWLLTRYSKFTARWEAYLEGEPEIDLDHINQNLN